MFKFIHAADIHLDSPLHGLERYEGAPVEEIRGATRKALANLVRLAIEEEVNFVLIAGDLYDGDWKDHNTGLCFVSQVVKLHAAGISVFAVSGNHDATSKMTRSLRLPRNPEGSAVMLSDKRAETIVLEPLEAAIHGQGFAKAVVDENVIPQFPVAKQGFFNIGLLHTSLDLETQGEHARYAPCTLGDLRAKGYQYWALGHIHQRETRSSDPLVAFPGNIQGRHIREGGEKGCLLVTVDDNHTARLEFRSLDVMRWRTCEVCAEGAQGCEEVLERFRDQLGHLIAGDAGLPLAVRVCVTGACPAHERLQADAVGLANEIRAAALEVGGGSVWIEKVKLLTTSALDLEEILQSDGPLAELMHLVRELQTQDAPLVALSEELKDLDGRLPDELKQGPDGLRLRDLGQLRGALDEVFPLLMARLQPRGAGA